MMENKKGFTLIELIAVFALIAVLSVVIGINMNKLKNNTLEKKYNAYKDELETAACVYAYKNNKNKNNNSIASVSFYTLIDNGYISKNLENPKTKKTVDQTPNEKIDIFYDDSEIKCVYVEGVK